MTVKAKFTCTKVETHTSDAEGTVSGKSINMTAVVGYNADGSRKDENESWSKYTPSGNLQIYITNPDAYEQFEEGKDYYLTFDPAQ